MEEVCESNWAIKWQQQHIVKKMKNVLKNDENTPVLYKMMGIELTRNLRFLAQVMKADRVLGIAGEMVGNRTSLFQYVDL